VIREFVKKRFWLTCAYYVVDNAKTRLRGLTGHMETDSGTAHLGRSIESSLAYIEEVFGDYKRYAGVERFNGSVAEVGPGDNCGVGLMCLADGCTSVDLVDRFYSKRDAAQHAAIYRALFERYPDRFARLADCDVNDETTFPGLKRHYGERAAAETFFAAPERYNFIVSRAVLEHVYDPRLAISCMAMALKSGGLLMHKVDFRDHGMFSDRMHELKFFEVPDFLYPRMTRDKGRPNRVLIDTYRKALAEFVPDHDILVTRLAGVGDIDPHLPYDRIDPGLRKKAVDYVRSVRSRFSKSLRALSDEDLSVAGIFLVARKRG
jgi:SAM-dependent methyltransferase